MHKITTFLFISCFSLVTLATVQASSKEAKKSKDIKQSMNQVSQVVQEMVPTLFSKKRPSKREIKRLQSLTKQLRESIHNIDSKDLDPTLKVVSENLEEEAKWAESDLKRGRFEIAQNRLYGLLHNCFSCHTTGSFGRDFKWSGFLEKVEKLDLLVQSDVLVATRHYDPAIQKFKKILSSSKIYKNQRLDWGKALGNALALAVRVKQDPNLAEDFLNQASSQKNQNVFFQENLKEWKKSVSNWKSELGRSLDTEEGYYHEGMRLIHNGTKLQQFATDERGMIEFLRASSVFHELIRKYPKGKRTAEALFFLGQSYDVLNEFGVWDMSNQFYERCIQLAPKSDLAKKCYEKYELNMFIGYSGSGGVHIPGDVKIHLQKLKKMAGY